MDVHIGQPEWIGLLGAPLGLALIILWSGWRRRLAQDRFVGRAVGRQLLPTQSRWHQRLANATSLLALVGMILGLLDLRWGKAEQEVPQRGLEVVFVLDVSRSMLAEDATPNRLARAKQQIKDLIAEMAGDRVGLVAFAGEARQVVPLTSHYDDFMQALDSLGTHSIRRGGSKLGNAIEVASKSFLTKTSDHKTMILFTDGEDQESRPIEVAEQLNEEIGLRIFTVGLGDFARGSRIPNPEQRGPEYVTYEGEAVWSKMDGEILSGIAEATGGTYIPAGTKNVDMALLYQKWIADIEPTEFEMAKFNTYVPRYSWFVAPAVVFLVLEAWLRYLSGRPRPTKVAIGGGRNRTALIVTATSAAWLFVLTGPALAQSTSRRSGPGDPSRQAAETINRANRQLRENRLEQAMELYRQVPDHTDHQAVLAYNSGVGMYRQLDFAAAEKRFRAAASLGDNDLAAASHFNAGNCQFAIGLETVKEDSEAAKMAFHSAIQSYRNALRLDRQLQDARYNLELAQLWLDRLDAANQPPEPPKQEDQQSSNPASEQQPSEDQQQDQQQNEKQDQQQEGEQQQKQPQPQQKQQQPQPEQGNQEQGNQEQGENSSDESKQEPSSKEPSSKEPSGKQPSQQPNTDEPTAESLPSDEATDSDASQDRSKGQLQAANSKNVERKEVSERKPGEAEKEGSMTREEAMKMLQSVRDRDLMRRLKMERLQRSRHVPVDRDW